MNGRKIRHGIVREFSHTDDMHRSTDELNGHLDEILASPENNGPVEMIVRRPAPGGREVVERASLSAASGLEGDSWSKRVADGEQNRSAQLTLMNARVVDAVAGSRERWPLAGDQIYVDLDLSKENLPAGTRLRLGGAVIEISEVPHTGCAKFASRYGKEALRFVNVGVGREHRFRGVNAFVVEDGELSVGEKATKA